MSEPFALGIDVGSSGCKAAAVNARGEVVAAGAQTYATEHPRPGWAVQHPRDWYAAACAAVRACMAEGELRARDLVALSLDGPAHSVALLGDGDEVIYPTIHTSDLRSVPQTERLEREHGARIFEISGQRANPSWTLSHLAWLREREPDVFARLRKIRVVKDDVRARLTGDDLTDDYDAIGTQLYDLDKRAWSPELCELVGLREEQLPRVAGAFSIAGALREDAARDLGLMAGAPVAVGSGDSVVEALGVGVVEPGQGTVKLATHANVNVVAPAPRPSPALITYRHVVCDYGFGIAATSSGAASLRWFRETIARDETARDEADGRGPHATAERIAARAPAGCDGLMFHPYLMGERTPHWDPLLRGSFIGIRAHHGLEHFMRAVLEGVAFSLRQCLEAHGPDAASELRLIGGGAKIGLWRRIVCDVIGRPLLKPAVEDAAFGAAVLAGVSAGMFSDWRAAVSACARVTEVIEPDAAAHELYSKLFEVYGEVARDLARHSHRLDEITRQP